MTITDPKLLPPPPGWEPIEYIYFGTSPSNGINRFTYECSKCGAVLSDTDKHTTWHLDDVKAYKLVVLTIGTMMRDIGKLPLTADGKELLAWATGT